MPRLRFTIPAELPQGETVDAAALLCSYRSGECDIIVVLGPTASGKTRYAVALSREINRICGAPVAEILSADSRQVYRGMDIGTGKDLSEYGEIPYHLIDIRPAGERYNVYRYQADFCEAYQDVLRRGCIPILCGGTGLYIEAAACSYDFGKKDNEGSPDPRADREGYLDAPPVDAALLPHKPYFIGTLVTREVRNARIDARLLSRLDEGMVEEIRGLLDAGVSSESLIHYGLEYRYVTLYLLGQLSYDEMVERLRNAIHQFAKRQMTWFRGMERDGRIIHWVEV